MERGLQDAFFSPSPILGEGAGGEVSESPEMLLGSEVRIQSVAAIVWVCIKVLSSKRLPC